MRTAVIGLGGMGQAFAGRALAQGHPVTVWNRSPGRTDGLAAAGAVVAPTAAAAAEGAEIVLVALRDDDAVTRVCLEDAALLDGLGPEAVVANASTVSPALARRLAAAGPAGRVLDTPVLGAPRAIAAGQGRFMVGGPAEAVAAATPLLGDLGSVLHCGPAGSGAVMKVVSNLLLITGVAAVAEGVVIARDQGIPDALIRTVLGDSPVMSTTARLRLDPVLDPAHPGWFPPAMARKDLGLALDLLDQAGATAALTPAAAALLDAVAGAGSAWPDFAAVIEAIGAGR